MEDPFLHTFFAGTLFCNDFAPPKKPKKTFIWNQWVITEIREWPLFCTEGQFICMYPFSHDFRNFVGAKKGSRCMQYENWWSFIDFSNTTKSLKHWELRKFSFFYVRSAGVAVLGTKTLKSKKSTKSPGPKDRSIGRMFGRERLFQSLKNLKLIALPLGKFCSLSFDRIQPRWLALPACDVTEKRKILL